MANKHKTPLAIVAWRTREVLEHGMSIGLTMKSALSYLCHSTLFFMFKFTLLELTGDGVSWWPAVRQEEN